MKLWDVSALNLKQYGKCGVIFKNKTVYDSLNRMLTFQTGVWTRKSLLEKHHLNHGRNFQTQVLICKQ